MTIGHGIAIAGIWLGVAISAAFIGPFAVVFGVFAMLATMIVVAN